VKGKVHKILVAGIGNIFLGDDAFGVEVVARLARRPLPEHVVVKDFGIRSYDLAYALMGKDGDGDEDAWKLAILVDALPRGGEPGALYTLEPELPGSGEQPSTVDAHTMNPVAVLHLVSVLGGKTGRVLVVGCEPGSVEPDPEGKMGDMGLSAPVEAAVDGAVRMIEELIEEAKTRASGHTTAA